MSPTWRSPIVPLAVVGALAATIIAIGLRGSDFPAQVFLSSQTRRYGYLAWSSNWYGGYPTVGYSVLSPLAGAVVSPLGVALGAGLVATVLFDRLVSETFGPRARIASVWFAMATVTNLIVGRVPFALGMAFGLGALYALRRGRPAIAAALAVVCALSSPLAGLFVALLVVAWASVDRTRFRVGVVVAGAAVAPTLVAAIVFPTPGTFPYEPWALARDLTIGAIVAVAARRRNQVIARGALIFMVVASAAFIVHSPVGGNISRLAQFAVGPILACLWWPRRKILLAAAALPLLVWLWLPAFQGTALVSQVPSTQKSYYEPVVRYVKSRDGVSGRVEIPFTQRHWEAAYVADRIALARGWERQIDIAYNPIFYDGTLNAATYRTWLADNAVEYVALPDAPLDPSSFAERDLIVAGVPYLHETWHNAHWRIYRFAGYRGMVRGPARLVASGPDSFSLRTARPGVSTVSVHYSRHWSVSGPGCVRPGADGWTQVVAHRAGVLEVTQSLGGTSCPR